METLMEMLNDFIVRGKKAIKGNEKSCALLVAIACSILGWNLMAIMAALYVLYTIEK